MLEVEGNTHSNELATLKLISNYIEWEEYQKMTNLISWAIIFERKTKENEQC